MKNREPIWWIPLLRRVLLWGVVAGLGAGVTAFFVVGAVLVFVAQLPTAGNGLAEVTLKIARISLNSAAEYAITGVVVGVVIAFYAPASESGNCWKSAFFRNVLTQTIKFWVLSCLVVWFGIYWLVYFFYSFINPDWLQIANFSLVRILLALSLWRAINLVLCASKVTHNSSNEN